MSNLAHKENRLSRLVSIPINGIQPEGMLVVPERAKGIVLFAHVSGSSRHSSRNNFVAQSLNDVGYAALLMDLLTKQEDVIYETVSLFLSHIAMVQNFERDIAPIVSRACPASVRIRPSLREPHSALLSSAPRRAC